MSKGVIPAPSEFMREALIVLGGAILAAIVLSQLPALRNWINNSTRGCDCER